MKRISMMRLAWNNVKHDRTRSILVTVSISLTMMLLTLIASYGYGTIKGQRANAGLTSGNYYAHFRYVTQKQLNEMRLRSEFSKIGTMSLTAVTEKGWAMYYADDTALSMNNMELRLKEGGYPESYHEIAAGAAFLEECGLKDPKPGDTVTLNRRFDLETPYEPEEYVVSGILKENEVGSGVFRAVFLSEEYYEAMIPEEERQYNVYFSLLPDPRLNTDTAETKIKELAQTLGIKEYDVEVNRAYLFGKLDPGYETISVCAVIILCIILFSVMVIYNIFQVGIVRKIREYGKIRAVGATKRQMKRLIWSEGMILAAAGIPTGLAAGMIATVISFDWMMDLENVYRPEGYLVVSPLSPAVLAAAVLICFLTVLAALYRPMKLVSSVSPVETILYQGGSLKGKGRSIRKGRKEIGVAGLAFASLSGQKQRTAGTILTMGLSCILFIAAANLAGNMDAEYDARKTVEFGEIELELSFSLEDQAYPENNLDRILRDNPLDEELLGQIESINGVREVRTQNILYGEILDESGHPVQRTSVLILDREMFGRKYEEKNTDVTYDSVTESSGILFGASALMQREGVRTGDRMRLRVTDGMQEAEFDTEVEGAFSMIGADWGITQDAYEKLGLGDGSVYTVWIDCEKGKEETVAEEVESLIADREHLEMKRYSDVLDVAEAGVSLMKLVCYTLSGMVAAISFLNMANTLIVSVITRRQEFGLLQAVGMTNAQLNKSLQGEGILYTIGTVLAAAVIGIPCGYGLFWYGKEHSWFGLNVYHLPVAELAVLAAFLILFQTILSFTLSCNVKRESVIERIRYQG